MDWYFGNESPSWDIEKKCLDPLVNVEEEDEEIVVTMDLPSVRKEDIEVRVKKDSLVVKAKTEREFRFESWGGAHRKVSFNSFRKRIGLPSEVDADESKARFKRGLLRVVLSKKKGKSIDVK